jgi:hypothetical protein
VVHLVGKVRHHLSDRHTAESSLCVRPQLPNSAQDIRVRWWIKHRSHYGIHFLRQLLRPRNDKAIP